MGSVPSPDEIREKVRNHDLDAKTLVALILAVRNQREMGLDPISMLGKKVRELNDPEFLRSFVQSVHEDAPGLPEGAPDELIATVLSYFIDALTAIWMQRRDDYATDLLCMVLYTFDLHPALDGGGFGVLLGEATSYLYSVKPEDEYGEPFRDWCATAALDMMALLETMREKIGGQE